MRFTLRQLSYFVAAGETGSVTRAAELVNISQPSVSAAISHLETELGVQIFVRQHAQGLALTTPGKRLLRAAKESLRAAYELYDVANAAGSIVSGPINVGSFRTFSSLIMPDLWSGFVSKYPDAQMVVTEGSEAELLEGLRSARIDIALTYQLNLTPDMSFQPLVEMPSYVLLAADHRFAARASVRLEELADEPFILLDLPLSRQYFLSMFEQRSITPRIVAETASPSTLRSYVGAGLGFSMLTVRPVNMMAENGRPLAYVELEGNLTPMVMGLACLKDMRRPRIVEAFEAHCREVITPDHIPGMRGTDPGAYRVIADER